MNECHHNGHSVEDIKREDRSTRVEEEKRKNVLHKPRTTVRKPMMVCGERKRRDAQL